MKISEAAAMYGVSAQAIYQRLQKSGKPLETLKANGSLTAEGVAYLEAYFNKKRQYDDKQNSSVDLIRDLQDKLKDAEHKIELLQSQLESAKEAKQKSEESLVFERRLLGRLLPSSGQVETDNRADAAAPVEVVASVEEAAPAEEKHRWVPWWRRG